jgi:hypothetical protein
MQLNKAVPAMVLVFIWGVVFDNFLMPITMGSAMAQIPGITATPSILWQTVGNACSALVLVWVYDRVRGAFASGLSGGALFGFYSGVLINFPTWLYMTVYAGWPYRGTWHATLVLIVAGVVSGALAGLVYEKVGASKTA